MKDTEFKKRKINFLDNLDNNKEEKSYKRPKKRVKKKRTPSFFIILIIIFTITSISIASGNNGFLSGVRNGYLLRQITHIISSSEKYINGEKEDRINFLLLGMGGAGHNGPYLTDTIILASFRPSTKELATFSLPRDMIVPLTNTNYKKINHIYTIGQLDDNTTGGELMKDVIERTLDMPIHYFAAVDFNGFIELIDAIGGIKVNVETSFTDNQFPTADYKYQEVHFDSGKQKMDGLTALRYARSRHGNNGEGSDFARIKRQQKILLSAKDKLTSFNTLLNPKKITNLFSLFNKYTTTDLEPWEAVKLIHMGKGLKSEDVIFKSIDDRPGNYLKSGFAEDGAYILQPVTGDYEQIQILVKNIFDFKEINKEEAKIVIQNGTEIPGLALKAFNHLSQMNYNVIRYGNSKIQSKLITNIYKYNSNNSSTEEALENIFQTIAKDNISLEYSNYKITSAWDIRNKEGELENLDFLIILGEDQAIDESIEIIKTVELEELENEEELEEE